MSSSAAVFTIQVREVPAMIVVFEHAEKRQDEVGAWVPGAMSRVYQAAEGRGGVARTDALTYLDRVEFASEPVFIVIYDGHPGKGPMLVDVTSPVAVHEMDDALGDAGVRHVPAHREAYVRLKRSEAEPSELWRAYEAVEAWILAQGLEIDAAPREIYYTDFFDAAPDDCVCDVAWPVR